IFHGLNVDERRFPIPYGYQGQDGKYLRELRKPRTALHSDDIRLVCSKTAPVSTNAQPERLDKDANTNSQVPPSYRASRHCQGERSLVKQSRSDLLPFG